MPRYTFKEGTCAECGSDYKGLICDKSQHRNTCPKCRGNAAVDNAKTLYFKEFIPYWDGGLGEYITSKRGRQDAMARHGVAEISDVANNDNYLLDDLQSHVAMKKRDNELQEEKNFKVDDDFLETYREVEARSGRTF
jgi:hypothetical protein